MKVKSQKDLGAGLLFVVAGLGFALGARNYEFGTSSHPGPGYFPFGLGLLLALIGVVLLLRCFAARAREAGPIGAVAWRPLVVVTGAVALAGVTLPWLGLFISLPLLVLTSSLAGNQFRPLEVAFNAAILTVGSWAVFIWGLGLMVPLFPSFMH